jgi:hypothetical protein
MNPNLRDLARETKNPDVKSDTFKFSVSYKELRCPGVIFHGKKETRFGDVLLDGIDEIAAAVFAGTPILLTGSTRLSLCDRIMSYYFGKENCTYDTTQRGKLLYVFKDPSLVHRLDKQGVHGDFMDACRKHGNKEYCNVITTMEEEDCDNLMEGLKSKYSIIVRANFPEWDCEYFNPDTRFPFLELAECSNYVKHAAAKTDREYREHREYSAKGAVIAAYLIAAAKKEFEKDIKIPDDFVIP